jgi:hypothetical protein
MSRANTRKTAVKTRADAAVSGSVTASASDDFFGRPPLLQGEDEAAYFGLLEKVRASVKPSDVLEEIATRDFVDITWEILRLRRMRQPLIDVECASIIKNAVSSRFGYSQASDMYRLWVSGEHDDRREVISAMAEVGLSVADAHARAIEAKIKIIERVDRLIVQAEHRRRLVIVELDRSRDVLARRLREAANIIDGSVNADGGGARQLTAVAHTS